MTTLYTFDKDYKGILRLLIEHLATLNDDPLITYEEPAPGIDEWDWIVQKYNDDHTYHQYQKKKGLR